MSILCGIVAGRLSPMRDLVHLGLSGEQQASHIDVVLQGLHVSCLKTSSESLLSLFRARLFPSGGLGQSTADLQADNNSTKLLSSSGASALHGESLLLRTAVFNSGPAAFQLSNTTSDGTEDTSKRGGASLPGPRTKNV